MIKYLILPGCGPNILSLFGAVQRAKEHNIWNFENLCEIYCTSAGSMLGFLIALDIEMNVIEQYMIERPWQKLIPKSKKMLESIYSSGIIDQQLFFKMILEYLIRIMKIIIELLLIRKLLTKFHGKIN